jgi:TolB-like protein
MSSRRIVAALVVWGVVALALLQAHEAVARALGLPEWVIVVALGLGFPASLAAAWLAGGRRARSGAATARTGARGGAEARVPPLAALLLLGAAAAAPGFVYFFVWPGAAGHLPALRRPSLPPSVAVLPFADLSPGRDQEYFADGVAEEILSTLSQVQGLRVSGRTSSFAFKGKGEGAAAIGARLGVGAVLDGSVRKDGGKVRITAHLVRASDGTHLWSRTFERDQSDVFVVQADIARSVAEALEVRLQPGWEASIRGRRTASAEAHEHYLRGALLLSRYRLKETREAQAELSQAVEIDPAYGPAWSELANAWALLSDWADPAERDGLRRRAMEAADEGVRLAPEVGDTWGQRAILRFQLDWDWAGAQSDVDRALALAPNDHEANDAHFRLHAVRGELADALAAGRRLAAIDPLDLSVWLRMHLLLSVAGQAREAREALDRAESVAPASYQVVVTKARAEIDAGRPASALALARRPEVPEDSRFLVGALALHAMGQGAEARRELARLEKGYALTEAYQIAEGYAGLGDAEEAIAWLERAWAQHDGGLVAVLPWVSPVRWNPAFRGLRGDPRFRALLGRMNLQGP